MSALSPRFWCLLCCAALLAGCGTSGSTQNPPPTDKQNSSDTAHADPHDVPLTDDEIAKLHEDTATWSDAMRHIRQYRDVIKQETTGGLPAKAHRSLDLLDDVLQRLPEITQKSNVDKVEWRGIGENGEKLRDLFNKVHANIDASKDPDYAAVADEIDATILALSAIKPND